MPDGGGRATQAFPSVKGNVVVIASRRKEHCAVTQSLSHFQAQHSGIESESAFEVSNFQMDVANVDLRVGSVVARLNSCRAGMALLNLTVGHLSPESIAADRVGFASTTPSNLASSLTTHAGDGFGHGIFCVADDPDAIKNIKQKYDALILGGGAAGLMCAIEAGRRGRRVAVLERPSVRERKFSSPAADAVTSPIIHCTPENFISSNPHFAKSALARYTPADFISLVEKHHIPYHEKTLGQLFCDRSAQDILGMLEKECADAGVHLLTKITIEDVSRSDEFVVRAGEREFRAPVLVVATGGLSISKDWRYRLRLQVGPPI